MKNSEDEEYEFAFDNTQFILTREMTVYEHDVHFDSEIIQPSRYRRLISSLSSASEHDTFHFYFNSGGGSVESAISIIAAIKNSQARVIAHIIGSCHSACSLIALNCPEIMVYEDGSMMIHPSHFGTAGHALNVKVRSQFLSDIMDKMFKTTYTGFLTEDELNNVRNGIEIWLTSKDIEARLVTWLEAKNAESENN